MTGLRVLHIGKFYPPTPGGIESFTAILAQAQVQAGASVSVLAHAPPGQRRTRSRSDGTIAVREAGCWGQLIYSPISPRFPIELERCIRRDRPDLLHIHVPNTSAFFALLSPAARRLPWVVHWHADIPLDSGSRMLRMAYPVYRPWEQALLKHANAIVATSAAYRDASSALAPWRAKVNVIPLALGEYDPTQSAPSPVQWPAGKRRLLCVGRLSHYKGFEVLLEALVDVPDLALVLIGSGEREAALRERVQTLGLANRVQLLGYVDQPVLDQAYVDAEIFCLPSLDRAEAFGMVLLEAMRAGLPSIASAIPGSGVGHVVEAEMTGLLVPPGNVKALAGALARLASDTDLCRRLGSAGLKRWREHFTPAAIAAQTCDLYRQVLGDRANRAAAKPTG